MNMKKNQWQVFGWVFFLISFYFGYWTGITGGAVLLPMGTPMDAASWVSNRMYSITYLITVGFAVACFINAWLEGKVEKKEKTK